MNPNFLSPMDNDHSFNNSFVSTNNKKHDNNHNYSIMSNSMVSQSMDVFNNVPAISQ